MLFWFAILDILIHCLHFNNLLNLLRHFSWESFVNLFLIIYDESSFHRRSEHDEQTLSGLICQTETRKNTLIDFISQPLLN